MRLNKNRKKFRTVKLEKFIEIITSNDRLFIKGPLRSKQLRGSVKTNLYLIGDIYGAYVDGHVWDQHELINQLFKNVHNQSQLQKLVRRSIGDFFIIVTTNRKATIFTSPGGHGLFYTLINGKIIISDLPENLLLLKKSHKVSDFELLQWMILSGCYPSPFDYIFEDLKCLMGGCELSISKDTKINIKTLIFPPSEQPPRYETFVDSLKGQAKVLVAECKKRKKPIYSLFSGGIDSTVLTLSITSVGGKVQPITLLPAKYRDLKAYEKTYQEATLVSKAMDLPFKIIPFDEFNDKVIAKQFRIFGSNLYDTGYLDIAFLENSNLFGRTNPLVFNGIGMGNLVGGPYTQPPFRLPFIRKRLSLFLNQRYFEATQYARWFQSAVLQKKPWWKLMYRVFRQHKFRSRYSLPANSYEYLVNMLLSGRKLIFNSDQLSSLLPAGLDQEFGKYKAYTVLKNLMDNPSLIDLKKNNLSINQFMSIARRISYSSYFWQTSRNFYGNPQKLGKYNYFSLAHQGPLVDSFSGHYLALKDISYPKHFQYKYFYERTGKSYLKVKQNPLSSKQNQRKHLPLVDYRELFVNSKPHLKRMLPLVNPKKSVVLEAVKNDKIRKFLHKSYTNVWKNVRNNPDLWPKLNRLYQMESHVRKHC